jgi:hypothetical protein
MFDEFQEIFLAIEKVRRIKISSELLEKTLPNFYHGFLMLIDDLSEKYNNKDILSLKNHFNCILEIQKDLDDEVLITRIPMLERALNDQEAYLSEYIESLYPEEKEALEKLGLI